MTAHDSLEKEIVRYEKRCDHVAVVTLDRPDARNAINGVVAAAIDAIVADSESDDNVRAVVLSSSLAKVFCAGADLAEIARGNASRLSTLHGGFAGITRARRAKPWIAAVDGAALAGGCEIVLACDMVVASDQARFSVPEVKRGLFAAAGAPFRLMGALPRNIAFEMLATGDPITADRAYAMGMVNRLCVVGEAEQTAIELARAIACNAPISVRETLAIARTVSAMSEADYWTESDRIRDFIFETEDAKEGPRAFLEKRSAVWRNN